MLGFIGECACRVPGGVSGLRDYPNTWEYDQEKKQYYYTAPTGVKVFLPRGVEPSSTPEDHRLAAKAAPSGSTSGSGSTSIGQDIGSVLKTAFSIPGAILGEAKPITDTIQNDPIFGPLAALGLAKAGVKPQTQPVAAKPWSTGEKLALAGGIFALAAVGGYALSRKRR
jgi:hypothetical protein